MLDPISNAYFHIKTIYINPDTLFHRTAIGKNQMNQYINCFTLLVDDYDKAIDYFTHKLGFNLIEDHDLGSGKRWVKIRPPCKESINHLTASILLAKPSNKEQARCIGRQGADRVMFFLFTDNFQRDHTMMAAKGVTFLEEPRTEPYGTVAVFEDLYGNRWDLLEPKSV